jgi:hypothetical protein
MTWHELIKSRNLFDEDILLFSTATTGLGADDVLLAFSYAKISGNGDVHKDTVYRLVSEDLCHKGMEYHKITPERMIAHGWLQGDFEAQINEVTSNFKCAMFSYNPSFQWKALTVMAGLAPKMICDLPLFLKAAESRIAISKEDMTHLTTLGDLQGYLETLYKKPPSMKTMMKGRGFTEDVSSDELPVEQNVNILCRFWELLGEQELVVY